MKLARFWGRTFMKTKSQEVFVHINMQIQWNASNWCTKFNNFRLYWLQKPSFQGNSPTWKSCMPESTHMTFNHIKLVLIHKVLPDEHKIPRLESVSYRFTAMGTLWYQFVSPSYTPGSFQPWLFTLTALLARCHMSTNSSVAKPCNLSPGHAGPLCITGPQNPLSPYRAECWIWIFKNMLLYGLGLCKTGTHRA